MPTRGRAHGTRNSRNPVPTTSRPRARSGFREDHGPKKRQIAPRGTSKRVEHLHPQETAPPGAHGRPRTTSLPATPCRKVPSASSREAGQDDLQQDRGVAPAHVREAGTRPARARSATPAVDGIDPPLRDDREDRPLDHPAATIRRSRDPVLGLTLGPGPNTLREGAHAAPPAATAQRDREVVHRAGTATRAHSDLEPPIPARPSSTRRACAASRPPRTCGPRTSHHDDPRQPARRCPRSRPTSAPKPLKRHVGSASHEPCPRPGARCRASGSSSPGSDRRTG